MLSGLEARRVIIEKDKSGVCTIIVRRRKKSKNSDVIVTYIIFDYHNQEGGTRKGDVGRDLVVVV